MWGISGKNVANFPDLSNVVVYNDDGTATWTIDVQTTVSITFFLFFVILDF